MNNDNFGSLTLADRSKAKPPATLRAHGRGL